MRYTKRRGRGERGEEERYREKWIGSEKERKRRRRDSPFRQRMIEIRRERDRQYRSRHQDSRRSNRGAQALIRCGLQIKERGGDRVE